MSLPRKELEKGQAQLQSLVSSHFFRNTRARDLPTFDSSEIGVGPRLGVGGFGVVCEVQHIKLDSGCDGGDVQDDDERGQSAGAGGGSGGGGTSMEEDAHRDADAILIETDLDSLADLNVADEHDYHYNLNPTAARAFMAKHSLRDGDARYAIKRLKPDLSDKEKLAGAKDLAIEAKFLAVVSHPNIIKMRGTAATDSLRYDFFVVLDRLYETLDEKIDDWAEQEKQFVGCCGGMWGAEKEKLTSLRLERITALYDVSKAMAYLHENSIAYRDMKPENLGFDVR